MKVNKKQLADIFGRDVRTITTWQDQGLSPVAVFYALPPGGAAWQLPHSV
ncbi:terminase small subunit [Salmonella enterica]|nr:terminase small subunit [Salmonella enterica subsp. salamae]EIP4524509.1 terminase small subunit [Salmonella enterica]EJG3989086.1 terminase small subunit [Salmonella enterica]